MTRFQPQRARWAALAGFGVLAALQAAPASAAPVDLARINREVNASIRYQHGVSWTTHDGRGNCTTFAMEKWRRLLAAGVDPARLHVAFVRLGDGESHAVLAVRKDDGRVVLLDSRNNWPEDAKATLRPGGYKLVGVLWGAPKDLEDEQ